MSEVARRDGPLVVLHADNHLLVVSKPAGVPTVPDESRDESLLDRARDWIREDKGKTGEVFVGVVHRLDRPVSGVVCFARTSKAAGRLSEQFRVRCVAKTYWGIGARGRSGAVDGIEGTLVQWLEKDTERNRVHEVREGQGRRAETRWRRLAEGRGTTAFELEPATGRPHQLRMAMRRLGWPLLGDLKYGAPGPLEDRSIALHAVRLELEHPTLKRALRFEAPVPTLPCWDAVRHLRP